jgi:LAS superfamily LD-carboxypeptidase LdcB
MPFGYRLNASASGNRRSSFAGVTNGHLLPSALVNVNSRCRVYRPMAGPLLAMLHAAARAGIPLWTDSCYRTYQQQAAIRKGWCAEGRCNMAALPGTSNHGWGKAVDLGEPGGMTFTSHGYRWLSANAGRFGFAGLGFEAWHWDWVR